MELRLSVEVNYKTVMAIVFQYPNGYRPVQVLPPVPVNANNNANPNNVNAIGGTDRNNNRILIERLEGIRHVPEFERSGNQEQNPGGQELENNEENGGASFFGQLVSELCSVYQMFYGSGTAYANIPARRVVHENQSQDNQRQNSRTGGRTNSAGMSREPSSSSLPLGPIPDIIQCHRTSFSIDVSFESRTTMSSPTMMMNPQFPASSNSEEMFLHADAGVYRDQPESDVEMEESWSFEFKLAVGPWRQVGRDLRRVADQLQLENSIRRRSTIRNRSLEFRLVMTVAVPTIALVGLGFAFLRQHL